MKSYNMSSAGLQIMSKIDWKIIYVNIAVFIAFVLGISLVFTFIEISASIQEAEDIKWIDRSAYHNWSNGILNLWDDSICLLLREIIRNVNMRRKWEVKKRINSSFILY